MEFLDLFLHVDDHLKQIISEYQNWTYAILFLIIFVETGLVIWPFLPGDSLLFAGGMLIAQGGTGLNIWVMIGILIVAAVLGDTANYFIGKFFGNRVLAWKFRGKLLVKPKYMEQTHAFYEKYGAFTVIAARFFPIIRTFVPFVAGIGSMNYSRFILFNVIGGVLWITTVSLAGFYLGEVPIVRDNFEAIVFGIIGVSVIPIGYGIIKGYLQNRKNKAA